jgi:hypothetical protein
LSKIHEKSGELANIKNDNGDVFLSEQERDNHIVNTFADIFKVPVGAPENFDNLIENFLGPDICAHPLVVNSKLSPEEAESLNTNISLQELDKAAKDSKIRTAPGIDGFNNDFIKKH